MGEKLIENCHLYFTGLDGEPVDLGEIGEITGKIEETTNNISLDYNEENPPTFNMTIPEDTSITLKIDEPIDWNALTTVINDNVITMDTKFELSPELRKEVEQIFQEKINEVIIPDKYSSKGLLTTKGFDELIEKYKETTSATPVTVEEDSKTIHTVDSPITIEELVENIEKNNIDSLDSLTYAIEEVNKLAKKCVNSLEKFAESSKLIYNKEKEKKGEKTNRTVAIVRFWDQKQNKLGTKDYYYFYKPISGHACFDDLERKYWIRNDTGRVYENPVVFKSLVPESKLLKENLQKITKTIIEVEPFKEIINIKGDNKMNFNKIFPNAEIGKAKNVKMSIYGPAFCTADKREIAFKDGEWIDVSGFTLDLYPGFVCPVKAADIVAGDFIKHLGTWCRVIGIIDNVITAENIYAREMITILPTKSMFGFDFYSKLILPFGDVTANMGDAFSNPFMTMMLFGGDSKDFNDMLPLMLMSGGKFDMSNPMMLYFLMRGSKGDKTDDINFDIGF